MNPTLKQAVERAIEFLENDEARDLLGLHRLRVGSELMTRGQLAAFLKASLIVTVSPTVGRLEQLELRVEALERKNQKF